MDSTTRNARFWISYGEAWVKITLKPGQTVAFCTGGETDEGYSCTAEEYEHTGDVVERRVTSWGRDCDGRHEYSGDDCCPLDNLRAWPSHCDTVLLPEWEHLDHSQRDYAAEAMGY